VKSCGECEARHRMPRGLFSEARGEDRCRECESEDLEACDARRDDDEREFRRRGVNWDVVDDVFPLGTVLALAALASVLLAFGLAATR
jgi:hypothetical protein